MRRSVKFDFKSRAVVTDITGNIPRWCKHILPYAQAESVSLSEGTAVSQFYSHFLFFIEIIEVDLHTDLVADYLMEDTSLLFLIMLEGNITFYMTGKELIAKATGNKCYATRHITRKESSLSRYLQGGTRYAIWFQGQNGSSRTSGTTRDWNHFCKVCKMGKLRLDTCLPALLKKGWS